MKPRYFVMENVPNLLSAEGGFFRNEIMELFDSMGYSLNMGILNAADYGVPQNRRRAVIIGKRDGKAPELPAPLDKTVTVWEPLVTWRIWSQEREKKNRNIKMNLKAIIRKS